MYLHLDDAFDPAALGMPSRDVTAWGPRLRVFAPASVMEAFIAEVVRDLPPFLLTGSGDFHHLTGAFLRNFRSPVVNLVSFDNHPDWDRRPPRWACGGWMNRALELPHVRRASVWGCGNFELKWPARVWGNHRVDVHGWVERYGGRPDCVTYGEWRARFEEFAASLRGRDVYVTVDMDCLRDGEVVTNWENGLFTADDIAWAIGQLRATANVIGGDICGAYSPPVYARRKQRFAAEWDRPKLPAPDLLKAREINTRSALKIWDGLRARPA